MSRGYYLGHVFTTISKDNFRGDVIESFNSSFNEDMNGNNGIDYLPEKVVADGYESTTDWAIDKAIKEYGIAKYTLDLFLSLSIGSSRYYDEYQYKIVETEKEFIVSVAWMCGD